MENTQIIEGAIIATAFFTYLLTSVPKILKRYWDERKAERKSAQEMQVRLIVVIEDLTDAMRKSSEGDEDAKKLLAGTIKACEAIAQTTAELREEVGTFSKLVMGGNKEPGYPEDNLTKPNAEDDEKAHAIFRRIVTGMSVDRATQEANEEIEKKTMLSAASLGPEEE